MNWKTTAQKTIEAGRVTLRTQLHRKTKFTRVQRRVLGFFWKTLPPEQAIRENLLFNCPTRLVRRVGTSHCTEWCTNNVLPSHYQYVPLGTHEADLFIVSLYAETDQAGAMYRNPETRQWLPIKEFFKAAKF